MSLHGSLFIFVIVYLAAASAAPSSFDQDQDHDHRIHFFDEIPDKTIILDLREEDPHLPRSLTANNYELKSGNEDFNQEKNDDEGFVDYDGAITSLKKIQIVSTDEDSEVVEALKPHGALDHLKNIGDNDTIATARVYYRGAQLWRIAFDDQKSKNAVAILHSTYTNDISMWGGNGTAIDVLLRPPSVEAAARLLQDAQVPYDVIIEDLQQAIDTENPPQEEIEDLQNRKGHRMTWKAYHRVDDMNSYLDYLAMTYPQLCSVMDIGKSVQGRPLRVLRISNGKPTNKAIWIDGGMHAREWISPASVSYIINDLIEEWEDQPVALQDIDWYFLPLANPDGYEYSHSTDRLWRKNRSGSGRCAGVDLNRNFGYRWGGQGASRIPCAETYAGTSAFSEPETRAIQNFMQRSAANFQGYISYHSYGQYVLYPWGYDRVVPPDYKDLENVGQAAAKAMRKAGGGVYKVGPSGSTLYPASGGSDDWAKGVLNIKYSYTVELRDSGRHGFILPASLIEATALEAMAAAKTIAIAISENNN